MYNMAGSVWLLLAFIGLRDRRGLTKSKQIRRLDLEYETNELGLYELIADLWPSS
jgi:hypothetical protein